MNQSIILRRAFHHLSLFLFPNIHTYIQILQDASEDAHSLGRISFLISLYFEARGELEKAVSHLNAVVEDAGQASGGDTYMREIARCHLRILKRRLVVQTLAATNNEQLCSNNNNTVEGGKMTTTKSPVLFACAKGCAALAHSLEGMVGKLINGAGVAKEE